MAESSLISLFVYGTLGFTLLLLGIVFLLFIQKKNRFTYETEMKEREYEYKNELLNSRLEIQEHLLNEVSREIHDNVGQVLSVVKVHLFSAGNLITEDKAIGLIKTSLALLDKAIEDLRNISHAQSAGLAQRLGLQESIRKELGYISALKNYSCHFEITGAPYSFTSEQELLIFRIAQEAIQNSIKHSKCHKLLVSANYDPQLLTLTIKDDGKGFDLSDERLAKGIGIAHMRHRAHILRAVLEIQSVMQSGTTVTLKMPYGL